MNVARSNLNSDKYHTSAPKKKPVVAANASKYQYTSQLFTAPQDVPSPKLDPMSSSYGLLKQMKEQFESKAGLDSFEKAEMVKAMGFELDSMNSDDDHMRDMYEYEAAMMHVMQAEKEYAEESKASKGKKKKKKKKGGAPIEVDKGFWKTYADKDISISKGDASA